jgi:class 3 adenylate cyclase
MCLLCSRLALSFTKGTENLALRIGLNSGPTTAGVLRGEKARFQLFGDVSMLSSPATIGACFFSSNAYCCDVGLNIQTVNTAARMESNGALNRIQVSECTAKLIQQAGKGHWLEERSDKVDAKGKGEMQTYWCDPNAEVNLCVDIAMGDAVECASK